jgi:hypothetical protein
MPNTSWGLLENDAAAALVGTWKRSTAQIKSAGGATRAQSRWQPVAAGRSNTRELLDTLLLWNPRVVLDANGQAV